VEERDGEPAGLTVTGRGGCGHRGKGRCCSLNQGQAAALLVNLRACHRGGGWGQRVIKEEEAGGGTGVGEEETRGGGIEEGDWEEEEGDWGRRWCLN